VTQQAAPPRRGPGRPRTGGRQLGVAERVPEVARVRREVARALDRERLLGPGERVVVACSGGPDSLTLLDALARLAPPRQLRLCAVHVDHGLRPGSAAEAGVVAAAAERRGLPCRAVAVRVEAGGSLQDAARRARHRALLRVAAELGATAIALGHTADDQAETVLMRALSGATPRALAGMAPRSGPLVRPLLRLWRRDILAYCVALGLEPLDDPSNRDPRFLRTRVRHQVLPALEAVFPAARRRLVALAEGQRSVLEAVAERTPAVPREERGGDGRMAEPHHGARALSGPMLDCPS
jgi:tRNA(Ile)-lysidine synthase